MDERTEWMIDGVYLAFSAQPMFEPPIIEIEMER